LYVAAAIGFDIGRIRKVGEAGNKRIQLTVATTRMRVIAMSIDKKKS
jgi:urease alpha subunit